MHCEYINSCIRQCLQIRPLVLTNPLTCITTHSIPNRPPANQPRISTSKQKHFPEMFSSPLEQSTCHLRGGTGLTTTSDRPSPPLSNFPAESKSSQQWQAKPIGCKIERKQKGSRNGQEGTGETIWPEEELWEQMVEERGSFGGMIGRKMREGMVMIRLSFGVCESAVRYHWNWGKRLYNTRF